MAVSLQEFRYRARQPRLGRWWRLWIACSAWWTMGALSLASASDGWQNGVLEVLAAVASVPAFFLLLGLTIEWIKKGKKP